MKFEIFKPNKIEKTESYEDKMKRMDEELKLKTNEIKYKIHEAGGLEKVIEKIKTTRNLTIGSLIAMAISVGGIASGQHVEGLEEVQEVINQIYGSLGVAGIVIGAFNFRKNIRLNNIKDDADKYRVEDINKK